MPVEWLYPLSGMLVGLLVGLTGVGGGSLMTPLLVLAFGFHPTTAVGTDLLFASATKTVGTGMHNWRGTVDWRIVRRLAAGSVPATLATLAALSLAHAQMGGVDKVISLVLGVALILTGLATLFRERLVAAFRPTAQALESAQTGRLTILLGLVLGTLVTLTSVGAGALGMTALLTLYPRAPIARLVGSDIAHAVPLTLLAGAGHLLMGSVDVGLLGLLLLGSIPGVLAGSLLASVAPGRVLTPILAATLALVGARLLA